MPRINESNIVIVVGDLGSGVNFVKNILLLDNNSDWPQFKDPDDRLEYFFNNIYPDTLKNNLTLWLNYEYKLRNFNLKYGTNITDEYADINTEQVIKISNQNKIIFFTHWPNTANTLKEKYPNIKIISVSAATHNDLLWQIKSYIDKLGIDKLQNFSFHHDIEREKKNFIKQFGLVEYYKFNILNMFEIMLNRSSDYKIGYNIAIGDLLKEDINSIVSTLNDYTNTNIDINTANLLHNRWKSLHAPVDQIYECSWFEKIFENKKYAQN